MRWKVEEKKVEHKKRPSRGEVRTINKFLFWPKKLKGPNRGRLDEVDFREEYRWLEKTKIKQVWDEYRGDPSIDKWEDFCWGE